MGPSLLQRPRRPWARSLLRLLQGLSAPSHRLRLQHPSGLSVPRDRWVQSDPCPPFPQARWVPSVPSVRPKDPSALRGQWVRSHPFLRDRWVRSDPPRRWHPLAPWVPLHPFPRVQWVPWVLQRPSVPLRPWGRWLPCRLAPSDPWRPPRPWGPSDLRLPSVRSLPQARSARCDPWLRWDPSGPWLPSVPLRVLSDPWVPLRRHPPNRAPRQ